MHPRSAFSREAIASGEFVVQKDSIRSRLCTTRGGARICMGDVLPGRSGMDNGDYAENLVDNSARMLRSLKAMEGAKLRKAKLAENPWSDNYWPIYQGVLGARYADASFARSEKWERNQASVTGKNSLQAIYDSQDSSSIDNLSPSEKYDLLVGDAHGTMTQAMWAEGQYFFNEYGSVENWMGICHGWAPASYLVPRPSKTVELTAADGTTRLKFYPADIKALASLLWAKAQPDSRIIGWRCDDKSPRTDGNGRVISQVCFDNNPGTWHLAVVNQVGVSKRSLIIDATYDYEVWNQPVAGYEYTYFNPQTMKPADNLSDASVPLKAFTADKFKSFRSREASAVVGVAMDLVYVSETQPSHEPTDSNSKDELITVRYLYDLELDSKGEIIGGEWYENTHPDFVWTPEPNARAITAGDGFATGDWDGVGAMPASWRAAALRTSEEGAPLARIVELMTTLSKL